MIKLTKKKDQKNKKKKSQKYKQDYTKQIKQILAIGVNITKDSKKKLKVN